MLFSEAFKCYRAKPKNLYWSVCAETPQGELVISLWDHFFERPTGNAIRYKDKASRWSGPGNTELRDALDKAKAENQTIRAIIVHTNDSDAVRRGEDASKLKNTFSVKENWRGRLVVWDGDNIEIEFTGG